MSWFPVGPNLVFAPVFAPADVGFKRLSRRNEGGWQGKVSAIAVDLTDDTARGSRARRGWA